MYRPLVVLALGVFAVGTDSFVIAGILPEMAASLGVSVTVAGQLITAYALAYAILSPVMAALTGSWPRKRVLLLGLTVFTLGNLATAFLPAFGLVLAGRIVAGLGAALISPTATGTGAALAPPEKRGRAIAVVMTGLSAATALGAPLGTAVAGLTGTWRATLLLIVALSVLGMIGVAWLLPAVPGSEPIGLRQRLAPVTDARIALTLLTNLLLYTGLFTVYSYISLGFARATHGGGTTLALLLFIWGTSATAGTLLSGPLTDRLGNRRIINTAIVVAALDFVLLPWTSGNLITAALALVIWGLSGWGALAPQTHRLLSVRPAAAPMLTGLASSAVYVGVSAAGAIGALGISWVGPYLLGPFGAILITLSLATAESANTLIRHQTPTPSPTPIHS
ncbi:MFS transporter [Nonomuraea sediminis]|uniref:MFS transporter n=1 Tax=Nonomuraea sediminis TaxID=2835864 RepID=UPI001BDC8F7B|nr:MFS transporter [Nonomuraea sediminis]